MTRMVLPGLDGSNPLGFMAALGLLRLVQQETDATRLGFLSDGSCCAFLDGFTGDLATLITRDAARCPSGGKKAAWWLQYEKKEKRGTKVVDDLKAPPEVFIRYLSECVHAWCAGRTEAAAYAAAFGTSVAVDIKGNTKPTALHFTAANQQFLLTVKQIRLSVTLEHAQRSLFEGYALVSGSNLRWDPSAERNWALMSEDPNAEGTSVDPTREWLAFRALPLLPTFPVGKRVITTAVSGRGEDMKMIWPLWDVPASLGTIRSLLQMEWKADAQERNQRGVFAVCEAVIRRTSQGYGNFGPASVKP